MRLRLPLTTLGTETIGHLVPEEALAEAIETPEGTENTVAAAVATETMAAAEEVAHRVVEAVVKNTVEVATRRNRS